MQDQDVGKNSENFIGIDYILSVESIPTKGVTAKVFFQQDNSFIKMRIYQGNAELVSTNFLKELDFLALGLKKIAEEGENPRYLIRIVDIHPEISSTDRIVAEFEVPNFENFLTFTNIYNENKVIVTIKTG